MVSQQEVPMDAIQPIYSNDPHAIQSYNPQSIVFNDRHFNQRPVD